jgi:hypothetical protein
MSKINDQMFDEKDIRPIEKLNHDSLRDLNFTVETASPFPTSTISLTKAETMNQVTSITSTTLSHEIGPSGRQAILIDGAIVVTSDQQKLSKGTGDKQILSETLYSSGDVSINRETVTAIQHPFTRNEPGGGRVFGYADQYDRMIVINTGAGDDKIEISQRNDGSLNADINGQIFHIVLAEGQQLAIRSGDGHDRIVAADNVTIGMDVRGGGGDDTITTGQGADRVDGGLGDDAILTKAGRDDVFGNSGNDEIDAGVGHDQAHGGDGNDVLKGSFGRDYLDGGQGKDVIEGGSANDILVGGQGNDTLHGQDGDDRVYTGAGNDVVDNAVGQDVVYGQSGEDKLTVKNEAEESFKHVEMAKEVGTSIIVEGSAEFQQRVQSDLDFLRSSPQGRIVLEQLDIAAAKNPSNHVTISEMANEQNGLAWAYDVKTNTVDEKNGYFQHTYPDEQGADAVLTRDASGQLIPGAGTSSRIEYNPSFHADILPVSAVTLLHELSHAYNQVTGTAYPGKIHGPFDDTGVSYMEFQATGLPHDSPGYSFPGAQGESNTNPSTENALRKEMGLPLRDSYTIPEGWDGGMGSPTSNIPPDSDRTGEQTAYGGNQRLATSQTNVVSHARNPDDDDPSGNLTQMFRHPLYAQAQSALDNKGMSREYAHVVYASALSAGLTTIDNLEPGKKIAGANGEDTRNYFVFGQRSSIGQEYAMFNEKDLDRPQTTSANLASDVLMKTEAQKQTLPEAEQYRSRSFS